MKKITLITILALVITLWGCDRKVAKPLEAPEFRELIQDNEDVQILDVRTFDEFYTGHIPDAYNLDFLEPGFKEGLDTLDRKKPVAVYCLVGERSRETYNLLIEMNFRRVYHLTGGTVAWRREKFEIEEGWGRYVPKRNPQ